MRMMPVIQADESRAAFEVAMMPHLEPDARQRVLDQWDGAAAAKGLSGDAAAVAALGLKVREWPETPESE